MVLIGHSVHTPNYLGNDVITTPNIGRFWWEGKTPTFEERGTLLPLPPRGVDVYVWK